MIKTKILILNFILIFFMTISCSEKTENNKIEKSKILDGLYTVEYVDGVRDFADNYIWIFSDNIHYVLYPGSSNSLQYEASTHFHIKNNDFYSCGLNKKGKPLSLSKCRENIKKPKFKITKIDTVIEKDFGYNRQIVTLKNDYHLVKITKRF